MGASSSTTTAIVAIAGAAAALALGACTLLTSADDLHVDDQADGGPAIPADPSVGDSGGLDGGSSSSSGSSGGSSGSSGTTPHDSGTFAPTDAGGFDAAPGTFCGLHPGATACTSFDDPLNIAAGFDKTVGAKSSIGADTVNFVSGPRSFLATIGAAAGPNHEEYASLDTVLATPVSSLHMRGSFRVVTVASKPNDGLEIVGGTFRAGAKEYQVNLGIDSDRHLYLDEWDPTNIDESTDLGVLADGWHTIDQTITFTAVGLGSSIVTIDGKPITVALTPNMAPAPQTRWSFGASWAYGPQSGWAVGWDDFVFEAN